MLKFEHERAVTIQALLFNRLRPLLALLIRPSEDFEETKLKHVKELSVHLDSACVLFVLSNLTSAL